MTVRFQKLPEFLQSHYRLRPAPKSRESRLGWLGPLLMAGVALVTRLVNLGAIRTLIFDETYYVKDAYALMKRGYEVKWPKGYDEYFAAGNFHLPVEGSFVVHPPVGKFLIGLGMEIFGNNPWGWRIAVCLAGAISVFVVGRIMCHLFGNARMATLASLLMVLDGIQVVMSRTALLDGILEMFILLGVLCAVRDQLSYRPRLLAALVKAKTQRIARKASLAEQPDTSTPEPPSTEEASAKETPLVGETPSVVKSDEKTSLSPRTAQWWRPWLFAAGVMWGLATAVKWSGLYVIAVFGIFVFIRELSARWSSEPRWISSSILAGGVPAFLNLVPISGVVYILSWIGWFTHPRAWGHTVGGSLWNEWLNYHLEILSFHTNLSTKHNYQSNPWGWLLQLRPTAFRFEEVPNCNTGDCVSAITSLGNPILWWTGFAALWVVVVAAFVFLDWRAALIFTGVVSTYGMWLIYADRTVFTFYTVVISPFIIMALTYVLGLLMGQWSVTKDTFLTGRYNPVPGGFLSSPIALGVAWALILLILAAAVFFYPVWTGMVIPRDHFYWRMWLTSWI